ncbi:MAG: SMI1/KNR4 family protein [Kofleriaceae bacterium]|nr:SMI1/KNR4 family protein [Myxococcales bacterium]MCB9563394.1 SMI1/KNR4 family protein [Kofleriaceae bacterium]MCB9573686.1 SMI1/KNR4 family protein [Kofleriaceae bacterium]
MTSQTLELIDRVRRRLDAAGRPCAVAGAAPADAIDAAEAALGCAFPPSYRAFLAEVGALRLPPRLGTVLGFVGLTPTPHGDGDGDADAQSVVQRTLHARVENRLGEGLLIVAAGAEVGEWYVADTSCARGDGEAPIFLFDVRDNRLDQQFYDDFETMVREVLGFVDEILDEELGEGAEAGDAAERSGDRAAAY